MGEETMVFVAAWIAVGLTGLRSGGAAAFLGFFLTLTMVSLIR